MPKSKVTKNATPPVRYAVVGLGHIAQVAVLPAFRHAGANSRLTALVSGDDEKLQKLGARYKAKSLYSYDQYEACLASGEVDAVYIALPNSQHAEYAVTALERGVHVLCEKPMALSEADCRRMIAASETSGAKLMIAYRLHFDEANLKAIEHAHRSIGEARIFNSSFTFQVRDPKNIRLKGEEGGSPLWDIGIYCINAARYIFRDEPIEAFALAANSQESRFEEIDDTVAVNLRFPGDRLATFVCSFGAAESGYYEVIGTKGSLCLDNAYEYAEGHELSLYVGNKEKTLSFAKSDQFAPELLYFSDCVRNGADPEPSGIEGLADTRVIRACEESQATGHPVFLAETPDAIDEKERPSLRLKIMRPAVRKPDVVHARGPSGD